MMEHPDELVYSRRHLWALTDPKKSTAVVGITEELAEMIGEIQSVDMPMVGDELDMDTYCIHLHLGNRIHHLRSPLSGRVIDINRDVLDSANLIHLAPYKHWLYKMEFDDPDELDLLMSAAQYTRLLDQL